MEDFLQPNDTRFTRFAAQTTSISLPEKFTFPFYYEPHPISLLAAQELQDYLASQTDWNHNFGFDDQQEGLVIGKMFGVLVVKNHLGELGYLSAFSGKLANENHHQRFVPPVFDILDAAGFYKHEEQYVNEANTALEALLAEPSYLALQQQLSDLELEETETIQAHKAQMKSNKMERDAQRMALHALPDPSERQLAESALNQASIADKFLLKDMTKHFQYRKNELNAQLTNFTEKIQGLRDKRKELSNALQHKIFDHYSFLNALGENKSLGAIFENTVDMKPPAGAGECAAPKLLQYAYLHDYTPIALAEFWWGQSPKSEVRVHQQYYPACRGKCEPILGHMLNGLEVDDNPLLVNPAAGKDIPIVYEDDYLLVVNKPAEFLSVPGKTISDSVYTRMLEKYPTATGPLIVHRLDMSTSGLLLIAKDKEVHQHLQRQFIKRTVKKRYVALLDGIVKQNEGVISLPLRVDLDDRPRQLVCFEYGKPAKTEWKALEKNKNGTRVYFYPITGRTHQLRVHAAHPDGLGTPIKGDDLYGKKADRLCLHAEWIEFTHPISKLRMEIQVDPDF